MSAAAGDDVWEGPKSRGDVADPRVRLYNASGVAALYGGGYPAVGKISYLKIFYDKGRFILCRTRSRISELA